MCQGLSKASAGNTAMASYCVADYRYRAGRWCAPYARPAPITITISTNTATPRSPRMKPIDAALATTDALGLTEKLVYMQIANWFGVDCKTLTRWHQVLTTSRAI
ncbi:hypothetical protein IG631_24192 [Alternaria alternata]|nr:hypothetical protein IG631_24192 [Alternaria alternata]